MLRLRSLTATLCLYFLTTAAAWSQQSYELIVQTTDRALPEVVDYEKEYATQRALDLSLTNLHGSLLGLGFLEASIDSISKDSFQHTAYLHVGKRYEWATLSGGNVEEEILSSIGFREKVYEGKALNPKQVERLHQRILNYCENNGYPFASIGMDSIAWGDNGISAVLHLQKNNFITLDSVIIKGTAPVAPIYLYNYLNLKPGMPYNESIIAAMETRLKEIAFVRSVKAPVVSFTPEGAKIYLYLERKKASQFNGILGVLPDDDTGEIVITGDAKLRLKNALGRGELIHFNWRKLQTLTQDLKIQFNYPFLLNTPFGVDLNFMLYKRDTTFLEQNRNIGLQYLLRGGNYIKAFIHNQRSDLLSTDVLLNQTTLPPYADVNTVTYGIGLLSTRLDYRLNPRRGYSIDFTGGVGNKDIRENPDLIEANPALYDGLVLRSTQYRLSTISDVYIPIKNRSTIRIGGKGGYLINENMFLNEMFRIGGIRTLRGFDEESIIASSYGILSVEFRYLLEQNSNVYAFFDQAWYENRTPGQFVTDTPYGFGAGISFETKAGIFSLNYALGSQFDNPILLRSAKLHFGFVSLF